jgi:hypothetical protein
MLSKTFDEARNFLISFGLCVSGILGKLKPQIKAINCLKII